MSLHENELAVRIVRRAADLWEQDSRGAGCRPTPEYIQLQVHAHNLLDSSPRSRPYWSAACAVRPARLPNRWRSATGRDPESALRQLAAELGA